MKLFQLAERLRKMKFQCIVINFRRLNRKQSFGKRKIVIKIEIFLTCVPLQFCSFRNVFQLIAFKMLLLKDFIFGSVSALSMWKFVWKEQF